MNNILFVICLIFAAVKGQVRDVATYSITAERSDEYIQRSREQYSRAIIEFDTRLETFRQYYAGRIESVTLETPMTTARVAQMEERLEPLKLMGDFSYKCVTKYHFLLPTVTATKSSLDSCTLQASNQLPNLLKDPQNYRNAMFNYLNAYFEAEMVKCNTTFPKTAANYTNCITTVNKNTNANVISYQKGFDNLMDLAECTAKANMKVLVNCVQTVTIATDSQLAETAISVNNCLAGKDEECKPCPEICSDIRDLQVDYKNETIKNPFFGDKEHQGCLLWNLK